MCDFHKIVVTGQIKQIDKEGEYPTVYGEYPMVCIEVSLKDMKKLGNLSEGEELVLTISKN